MDQEEQRSTLKEVAATLDVPYQTVYAYWHAGRIPYERYGNVIVVKLADARAALKDHKPKKRYTPPQYAIS